MGPPYMSSPQEYLKKIEKAYSEGNATEHTHRPALKEFIESLATGIVATNEPRRVKCGAPDYIITKGHTPLGYIEAKDIGKSIAEVERSEQIKRYLESLGNLVLTDYLEFRWYVSGQHRLTARLAAIENGKIKAEKDGISKVEELLYAFLNAVIPTVTSPKELAIRMSAIARLIRDTIQRAFKEEDPTDDEPDPLHDQLDGFRKVLIHDLTPEQFADMYAQTICYGLFAARCNVHPSLPFARQSAGYALPKTNPFLRKMFNYIAGADLDDRLVWAVDDLAELLNHTDIEAILKDFGKRTRQEDPVVHFYESFLAAYDSKMRKARGVYYTPEPVVSYIVKSIDHVLKTDFKLPDGLADSSKIKIQVPGTKKQEIEVHKVQVLDPATGTGTFLHGVVDQIYDGFKNDKGMWSNYVHDHLLPRLFGFEIIMAPYAVAHMKLGLQLKESGYDFTSPERIRIYLTNTLEEAHAMTGLPLFTQWIAEEANAASNVKKDSPVMVILGNPPYSNFGMMNKGEWILDLLQDYKSGLNEKKLNLDDDFIKFIRFGQWRIEQTGYGVLGFITNNTFIDGITHRRMRQSLMQTFDDIYILDLHGNSKKKEKCPDGTEDKNIFDIQQGVSICILVRKPLNKRLAKVYHAELWGKREDKYKYLSEIDISTTNWQELFPTGDQYFFVPKSFEHYADYQSYWKLTDIFEVFGSGVKTERDRVSIHINRQDLVKVVDDFRNLDDTVIRNKYNLEKDSRDWSVNGAKQDVLLNKKDCFIRSILYRPYDIRHIWYSGKTRGFVGTPGYPVMRHMIADNNIAMIMMRQVSVGKDYSHFLATRLMVDNRSFYSIKGIMSLAPLYLYPSDTPKATLFEYDQPNDAPGGRKPNLSPKIIEDFAAKLSMQFIHDGKGDCKQTFGPEDIFNYMYSVFHSPTYRSRYAEFLKIDFPRLPLTSNPALFRDLCLIGDELVALNLMEKHGPKITGFPVAGDTMVDKIRYTEPMGDVMGKVWINKTQYFDGVPKEVWEFHVGGYQVCDKWLKDRKGRHLTYDDLTHYQHIVAALANTISLMERVDKIIISHGGWPIN